MSAWTLGSGANAVTLTVNGTLIANGFNITISNNGSTFGGTGTVTFTTGTLSLAGTWSFSGTFNCGTSGTVNYTGGAAQTIANVTYYNLTYSGTNTGTFSPGTTNIGGALVVSSGTVAVGANTITTSGTISGAGTMTVSTGSITSGGNLSIATLTITAAATINVTGNISCTTMGGAANAASISLTGNWSVTAAGYTAGSSIVTFKGGGASSVTTATTFYSVVVNNSSTTVTLGANVTVGGTLAITAGTFDPTTFNLTVTGATSVTGTYTDNSANGVNTFNGGVTINAGGTWNSTTSTTTGKDIFASANGLTNNSSNTFMLGDATFSVSQALGGSGTGGFSFSQVVTLSASAIVTNNATVTMSLSGAATLTGAGTSGWTQGNGSTLNYAGSTIGGIPVANLTFNTATNTVNYTFSTAVFNLPATSYSNLELSGTGAFTCSLTANLTIGGNLTILNAAQTLAASTYTINLTGGFSNAGTITSARSSRSLYILILSSRLKEDNSFK